MEKKFCLSYKCFSRYVFLFEDLWHTNIMNIIEKIEMQNIKALYFLFCLNKKIAFMAGGKICL